MTTSTNGKFDRTPLIAGNWKMNMDHVQGITLLQKLAWTLEDAKHDFERVEVAVFPPFTDLRGVQTLVAGDDLPVAYGGQDLSPHDSGAYTGDISGSSCPGWAAATCWSATANGAPSTAKATSLLSAKMAAAYRHGLIPVLCVGEGLEVRTGRNPRGPHPGAAPTDLEDVTAEQAAQLVVAYEPVWAIGTGEVAGPGDAQEMCAAIRAELETLYDAGTPPRCACCTAAR